MRISSNLSRMLSLLLLMFFLHSGIMVQASPVNTSYGRQLCISFNETNGTARDVEYMKFNLTNLTGYATTMNETRAIDNSSTRNNAVLNITPIRQSPVNANGTIDWAEIVFWYPVGAYENKTICFPHNTTVKSPMNFSADLTLTTVSNGAVVSSNGVPMANFKGSTLNNWTTIEGTFMGGITDDGFIYLGPSNGNNALKLGRSVGSCTPSFNGTGYYEVFCQNGNNNATHKFASYMRRDDIALSFGVSAGNDMMGFKLGNGTGQASRVITYISHSGTMLNISGTAGAGGDLFTQFGAFGSSNVNSSTTIAAFFLNRSVINNSALPAYTSMQTFASCRTNNNADAPDCFRGFDRTGDTNGDGNLSGLGNLVVMEIPRPANYTEFEGRYKQAYEVPIVWGVSYDNNTGLAPPTPPFINFTNPTDANNTLMIQRNQTYINVSVPNNSSSIDTFIFNWNGTNVSTQGLVLNMHFNNDTWDYSGKGNNGTSKGANCTTNVLGKFGTACEFNVNSGNNQFITLGRADPVQANRLTISMWVKSQSTAGTQLILCKGRGGNYYCGYTLGIVAGKWYFSITNITTAESPVSSITPVTTGVWTHISSTFDGTTQKIYINGVLDNSAVATQNVGTSNNERFFIGGLPDVDSPVSFLFNGTVDELRIYERNLSNAEINASYLSEFGKYNDSNIWFMNQTGLNAKDGNYTYYAWVNDSNGNSNLTETRTLIVDTAVPVPSFVNPTVANNTFSNKNWTYINVSIAETNPDTTIFNWNGTNVSMQGLMLNMHFNNDTWDYSGYGNNGANNGANCSANVLGKFGSSCDFSINGASNSFISVPAVSTLNFGSQITVMLWAYWNGSSTQFIFSKTGSEYELEVDPNQLRWLVFNTPSWGAYDTPTNSFLPNQWNHIAAVMNYNSGAVNVYINGVNQTLSKAGTGTSVVPTTDTFFIGKRFGGTPFYFTGKLDEIHVYNRTLSNAEINASYLAEFGKYNDSNIWFMNQTSLKDGNYTFYAWVNDSAGNTNQTVTNSVTVDTIIPSITFTNPTDANNSIVSRNWTYINVSASDTYLDTVMFNWNGTNVSTQGLVLNLHLNNDTWDYSGFGNHGAPGNGVNCSAAVSGKFGSSCQFNARNSQILASNSDSLNMSQSVTIEAWIYQFNQSDTTHGYGIVSKGQDGNGNNGVYEILTIQNGSSSDVYFRTANTTPTFLQAGTFSHNQWVHIAVTLNSTTKSNYLNGVLAGTQSVTGPLTASSKAVAIGIRNIGSTDGANSGQGAFHGYIDEVRIYNRALTNAEINASYNAEFGRYNNTNVWFMNQTSFKDGNYTFYAWVNDSAGNTNQTATRQLMIDTTPPIINIISPSNPYSDRVNLSVNFGVNESQGNASCALWINTSGTYSVNASTQANDGISLNLTGNGLTTDGEYGWYINCSDGLQQSTKTSTSTYRLDSSFPLLNWIYPTLNNLTKTRTNFTSNINCSDENLYRFNITYKYPNGTILFNRFFDNINTTTSNDNSRINFTITGVYTVEASCTDDHTFGTNKMLVENTDAEIISFVNSENSLISKLSDFVADVFGSGSIESTHDYLTDSKSITFKDPGGLRLNAQVGVWNAGADVFEPMPDLWNPSITWTDQNYQIKYGLTFTAASTGELNVLFRIISDTPVVFRNHAVGHYVIGDYYGDFQDLANLPFVNEITRFETSSGTYINVSMEVKEGQEYVLDPVVGGLNTVTQTVNISFDATPPQIVFTQPTPSNNSYVPVNWAFVNVSFIEPNNHTFIINFNGTNYSSQTLGIINASTNAYWHNFTNLSDGNYTIYAWTNDTFNNTNQTNSITFTVDTTIPFINFTQTTPENNTFINMNRTFINTSFNEPNVYRILTNWNGTNGTIVSTLNLSLSLNFDQNTADTSINKNNGIAVNTSCTSQDDGIAGTSCNFTKSSSYVVINTSQIYNFSRSFAIMAWVKPTIDTYSQMEDVGIICKGIAYTGVGNAPAGAWCIDTSGSGNALSFRVLPRTQQVQVQAAQNLLAGNWYHLVGIYDAVSGKTQLFINGVNTFGVSALSEVPNNGTYNDSFNISIGNLRTTNALTVYDRPFNGSIDEVHIYDRNLSSTEIYSIYSYELQIINKLINGTFKYQPTNLSDGNYTFYSWINDSAGNTNQTFQRLLIVDTTSPSILLNVPTNNSYVNISAAQFNYTPSDTYLQNCSIWTNMTGAFLPNKTRLALNNVNNNFTITLADGSYLWNVQCNDSASNTAFNNTNYTVTIDTTTPTLTFVNPTPNNGTDVHVNYTFINVSFNEANNNTFIINFNGTNYSVNASDGRYFFRNFTELNVGNYTFYSWINDSAGNTYVTQTYSIMIVGLRISAFNNFNTTTIPDYSVNISNSTFSEVQTTRDGLIIARQIASSGNYNITIFNSTYFNITENVASTGNNLINISTYQTYLQVNGSIKISNAPITGAFNVTAGNVSNYTSSGTARFLLNTGNYTINGNATGFINPRSTTAALSTYQNSTINLTYYTTTLNISAHDYFSNATLTGIQVIIQGINYTNYYENYTNISGSIATIGVINGSYNLNIKATGYGNTTLQQDVTPSDTNINIIVYLLNANNIYTSIYDEETEQAITQPVFVQFIGPTSVNTSTSNGTLLVTGLTSGDYRIRYGGGNYTTRNYYFTQPENSSAFINLYLLNTSVGTLIPVNVKDQFTQNLEGAIVKLLRYYISTNTYKLVEMTSTDSSGNGNLFVNFNNAFYKYIITYNTSTLFTSNPNKIIESSLNFQVNTGTDALSIFNKVKSIHYTLTYSNSSQAFLLTYDDTTGLTQRGCLKVTQQSLSSAPTLTCNRCESSASSTIICPANSSAGTFTATAFIYPSLSENSTVYILNTISAGFNQALTKFGKPGAFLSVIVIGTFALLAATVSPAASLIFTALGLVLSTLTGLLTLQYSVLMGLILLIVIAIMRLRQ